MSDVLAQAYRSSAALLAAHPILLDGIRIFASGLIFEATRRALPAGVGALRNGQSPHVFSAFNLTVRISEADECYLWVHRWLSERVMLAAPPEQMTPVWTSLLETIRPTGRCPPRDVTVQTSAPKNLFMLHMQWDQQAKERKDILLGKVQMKMTPSVGHRQAVKFQGHTLHFQFYQVKRENEWATNWIEISAYRASHSLFNALVDTARVAYLSRDANRTAIYTARTGGRGDGDWQKATTKSARPWESIILPRGLKESLLDDASEFLQEEQYYRLLGLPYRRGYLLYGPPGSGKTSLVLGLASQLKLDVYFLSLSAKSLDDGSLLMLMTNLPSRTILLIEDVDCAMKDRKTNEAEDAAADESKDKDSTEITPAKQAKAKETPPGGSSVTLSGLLNALDGAIAGEGRLLFCTTNYVDRIDHALSRPGRCDVWTPFSFATKSQAEDLYLHFYAPGRSTDSPGVTMQPTGEKPKADLVVTENDGGQRVAEQASSFAAAIPDEKVSMSGLQGYLMRYKRRPADALAGVDGWVQGGFSQTLPGAVQRKK